jgi:hypothetical protein
MTPPLSMGSKVLITGPAFGELCMCVGEEGEITEISERGNFRVGGLWYPASSLRLVKEELKIGDWVEVLPGICDSYHEIFQITDIKSHILGYGYYGAKHQDYWYKADLRKLSPGEVEEHLRPELKIGDWVEIVGPTRTGGNHDIGGLFRISHKTLSGEFEGANDCTGKNFGWYHAKRLRKLTSKEVFMHTGTIGYKIQECQESLDKVRKGLGMPAIEGRLSAIEKRQEFQAIDIKGLQLRLDPLEKYQRGEGPEVYKSQKGTCDEEDCQPNTDQIHITIAIGRNKVYIMHPETCCPAEALEWCERLLDSIREG